MSDKTRTSLLSLAIIIVLVISAFSPLTVYADEGTPAETPPAETSGEGEEAGQETTKETSTAEGETSTAEASRTGTVEEAAKDTAPAQDAGILSEVPEDTAVTVLDENGEAQPLATEAAAEAISTSDPIWCPGSQAPTPGANGCTPNFNSFTELLTFLSGNLVYQGAGTIYVQQGAYQGNDPGNVIDFNSYNLDNIDDSNLTVTGGWNTSTNTVESTNPTVLTEYSILIGSSANPWGGSLTINNLSIVYEGVPDWSDDTNGLTLHTDGDINLSNVSVIAAPGVGAELHAGGNTNIQNSNFQQNVRGGAVIRAGGNVNIANSSFGNPAPDVDRWQRFGLDVESGGSTSLFGVLANMNREAGATINAGGRVTIGSSFFNGTKEMWDDNGETVFLGYGLHVITPDSVDLLNVTGNDNFLWGARVDAGGDIAIADSVFNLNTTDDPGFIDDTGLFINGGANVSFNNVTANDNRLFGAQIDAVGQVSINNSTFNNNRGETMDAGGVVTYHGHGLQISSLSDIFIGNTNAVNNTLFGGHLTAGGEVAISNSTFSDTSTGNDAAALGVGLDVTSTGNTSLANVVVSNNQTVGADIQAGGDVFLDFVTATDNGTNGVMVQANCAYLFGGLYAGNGQYGLYLDNTPLSVTSPATFVNNGAGDIFPPTPPNCPAPATNNAVSSPSAVSMDLSAASFGSMDLNTYLANSRIGSSQGVFIGKYNYVHSDSGLQIVALQSSGGSLAMGGS